MSRIVLETWRISIKDREEEGGLVLRRGKVCGDSREKERERGERRERMMITSCILYEEKIQE